jgi:hypothetical protein
MDYNVYKTIVDGEERFIISIIPLERGFKFGLPGMSIIGYLKDSNLNCIPENIHFNSAFITLFHRVVKSTSIKSKSLVQAAETQKHGFIYIVDLRDKNYPNTKGRDIIGSFALDNDNIIEDSYLPNPHYQVISLDGLFKLPFDFENNLMESIMDIN